MGWLAWRNCSCALVNDCLATSCFFCCFSLASWSASDLTWSSCELSVFVPSSITLSLTWVTESTFLSPNLCWKSILAELSESVRSEAVTVEPFFSLTFAMKVLRGDVNSWSLIYVFMKKSNQKKERLRRSFLLSESCSYRLTSNFNGCIKFATKNSLV